MKIMLWMSNEILEWQSWHLGKIMDKTPSMQDVTINDIMERKKTNMMECEVARKLLSITNINIIAMSFILIPLWSLSSILIFYLAIPIM